METTCSKCGSQVEVSASDETVLCAACQNTTDHSSSKRADETPESQDHGSGSMQSDPSADTAEYHVHPVDDPQKTRDFTPLSTIDRAIQKARDEAPKIPVPESIGRFEVRRELGRGGFGLVYLAYDTVLDREVALKVSRMATMDEHVQQRFLHEAKATARLQHPNIVTLFDCGESEFGPYLATEFVDGETLSARLRRGPVDIREAVDWVRQIAGALQYAHDEGLVHRDIKPGNIMLGKAGRPQVMDFGLAKLDIDEFDSQVTREGEIVGTPAYMSPEQAAGNRTAVGNRSDQFSLGVVLYELLCGGTPYRGSVMTILPRLADLNDHVPSLRSHRPDLPLDLEACCLKALEKHPDARYATMQQFADDLNHWLHNRPLLARPLSTWQQLKRWCRSNQLIAGLAAALVVCVMSALVVGYILAFKFQALAESEGREAQAALEAQANELEARLETDALIIDTYTENGFIAARAGHPEQAALWFGMAASRATNHPERLVENRRRLLAWMADTPLPNDVYRTPGGSWLDNLSFHPSGRYLLAESHDAVSVRDLSRKVFVPLADLKAKTKLTWNPSGDELVVANGTAISRRSFPEGREIEHWEHADEVTSLAFTPDGNQLVMGGSHSLRLWDKSRQSLVGDSIALASPVMRLTCDPSGHFVAVSTGEFGGPTPRELRFFDIESTGLKERGAPFVATHHDHFGIEFLGNDRCLLFLDQHETRCVNLKSQQTEWTRQIGRVLASGVSPDRRLCALGVDSQIKLISTDDGREIGAPIRQRDLVYHASFNRSGNLLAVSYYDKAVRIYDVTRENALVATLPHQDTVTRCLWSPDSQFLATNHWSDLLIRTWSLREPSRDVSIAEDEPLGPFLKLNADQTQVISSGLDGVRHRQSVRSYDVETGQPAGAECTPRGFVSDVDFIPNTSQLIVVGSRETSTESSFLKQAPDSPGVIQFFDSTTGETLGTDLATPSQPIAVAASPDGLTAVVLCQRGDVLLIETRQRSVKEVEPAFVGLSAVHGFMIRDRLRFSPTGKYFALWGHQGAVEVRATATGAIVGRLTHAGHFVHDVVFAPQGSQDQQLIATCGSDQQTRIWSVDGQPLDWEPKTSLSHSGWVFNAQFDPTQSWLLTGSGDQQARVWDVLRSKPRVVTRMLDDQVYGACFLPTMHAFATVTRDGSVDVWNLDNGKSLAPTRQLGNAASQVSVGANGRRLLVAGRREIRSIDIEHWIPSDVSDITPDDARLLGELISSQRIHDSGAATSLSVEDWLARWDDLQKRHADLPVFQHRAGASGL